MSNSSQEAIPYLCTVSSEMSEPIDRNECTAFRNLHRISRKVQSIDIMHKW